MFYTNTDFFVHLEQPHMVHCREAAPSPCSSWGYWLWWMFNSILPGRLPAVLLCFNEAAQSKLRKGLPAFNSYKLKFCEDGDASENKKGSGQRWAAGSSPIALSSMELWGEVWEFSVQTWCIFQGRRIEKILIKYCLLVWFILWNI